MKFLQELDRIHLNKYDNTDCADMTLTSIEKALKSSSRGSYVFVFTDSLAKDYTKVEKIKKMCYEKQSQVFILTEDCNKPFAKSFTVYYDIAGAFSGLVFRVTPYALKLIQIQDEIEKGIMRIVKFNNSVSELKNVTSDDGISLAFAIDETMSMEDDINQVKQGTRKLLQLMLQKKADLIKNLVLVTFHDGDDSIYFNKFTRDVPEAINMRKNTISPEIFRNELSKVGANYNGGDCPEFALSGLQRALEESKPNSYVYLFTDAGAKDYAKLNIIKKLCQTKQSQVIIVYSIGHCHTLDIPEFNVYQDVAMACSGQFIMTPKDNILPKVRDLVDLSRKQSIFKWKIVERTSKYVAVPFTLDEMTEYAKVSANGENVELKITYTNSLFGPEPTTTKQDWDSYSKVLLLHNPKPGTYYAWVKGDSKISVVVYGRTDFTFDYGFSILKPIKSLAKTLKQPVAGVKQRVTVNVDDAENAVDIKTLQILDVKNNDALIIELPLTKTADNMYITEPFISPNHTFRIGVVGEIKATKGRITRYSRTNIDPLIVDLIDESAPVVDITNGQKVYINYGSNVVLMCDVNAHPKPHVVWRRSDNQILPAQKLESADPKFASYLSLNKVKQDGLYICEASNKLGTGKDTIQVKVNPVFTVPNNNKDIYNSAYGANVNIPCRISSYLPITIKWFKAGRELLGHSSEYSISSDRTTLTVKSMNIEKQGTYFCEAFLNSDPSVKQKHTAEVTIPGLARPVINNKNRKIEVREGEKVVMDCRTGQAYPKPEIKWFQNLNTGYIELKNNKIETFSIEKVMLGHAGQYKCVVTNPLGGDTAVFDLTVTSPPKVKVSGPKSPIEYDSNVNFGCIGEGFPLPDVVWKDAKGLVLPSQEESQENKYEFSRVLRLQHVKRSGIFFCEVTNKYGSVSKKVTMEVKPPFQVNRHIDGTTTIPYGTDSTLLCDIKSKKSMTLSWYVQMKGQSNRMLLRSSGKYAISENNTKLIIKAMDIDMPGQYTCEAVLDSDPSEKLTFSTNVLVTGIVAPKITSLTTDLKDKKLTVICRVQAVPPAAISWQFKQRGSDVFRSIPGSEEKLHIPQVRLWHAGVYKCIAKSVLGVTSQDATVVVEEIPTIAEDATAYYGLEGDDVMKIPCNITGFPDPVVIWKKNGKIIVAETPKFAIKENALYLNKPIESDAGVYLCEATNKLGSATKRTEIDIQANFYDDEHYYGKTHDFITERGKPVILKCPIDIPSINSVRWYKDGVYTNITGHTYTIKNVSFKDDGNYTCRVNTAEGSVSATYLLNVGYPPYFDDQDESIKTIDWKDSNQVLDCKSDSIPEPKYVWTHNGKVIVSEESFAQIPVPGWGEFKCIVSNALGRKERKFNVTSEGCLISQTKSLPKQPLLLAVESSTWAYSVSSSYLFMKPHEQIKLSCPNNGKSTNNFKMIPEKTSILAECLSQDMFTIDGKTFRYSDLLCDNRVEPVLRRTSQQCYGNRTELYEVGYEVDGFLKAYKVCYSHEFHLPLYATPLTRLSRFGSVSKTEFEWNSASGLEHAQTGHWKPEESCECCYMKGQLVNVEELPMGPAQAATFKDNLNLVPVWNPSCDGSVRLSWQSFNKNILEIQEYFDDWSSWTGASDYVKKEGGFVPRYLWKVIHMDGDSVAMVYVNDRSPNASDVKCSDSCSAPVDSDQFLYCCSIEEFSQKFKVPAEMIKAF